MFICQHCGLKFEGRQQMYGHSAVHTPRKPLSSEDKRKLSEMGRKSMLKHNSTYWTAENKKKHSDIMKQKVHDHPESYSSKNVSGRVKMLEYNGNVFKGNWEKTVAVYLDKNNIRWSNKIDPIKYHWNNSIHLYFPDFYLPEYDLYVEVKGYERERDRCKWKAVPNLIVLKKEDIHQINKGLFDIQNKIAR